MTASPLRRFLGAGLGFGFIRPAPGTWGSAGALIPFLAVFALGDTTIARETGLIGLAIASLVVFVLGVWLGNRAELDWGRDDPGGFVLDEVVGQWIALAPLVGAPLDALSVAIGFAAFRLFDITKPPPCRWLEDRHGGLGIMADDVAAGVYAAVVVVLVAS